MRTVNCFIAASLLTAFAACSNVKSAKEDAPLVAVPTQADLVKRGDYLVNSMGCDDCHSPKRMGSHGPEIVPELRFSGYPAKRPLLPVGNDALQKGWMLLGPDLTTAVGPWGQSFAANITSDETGIGAWTEQHFFTAIRKGKAKGIETNRSLLPPMPWEMYRNLNDEDLRSIFAYLKSTTPVANLVPQPIPPPAAK